MWLITVDGFYSVVQKHGEDRLTVRARVGADLDRLRELYMPELSESKETPDGDYRYRAWISHDAFADGVARVARDINYDNFKNEISRRDRERAWRYSKVWSVLGGLQPGGPYGMNRAVDEVFAAAIAEAADAIVPHPSTKSFRESLVEDALVAALRRELPTLVVEARGKHSIPEWEPQPGALDIVVRTADGYLAAVAELKVDKTGETLWDIFKVAALAAQRQGPTAFVVVAAREATWASEKSECAALFAGPIGRSRSYPSADLFDMYAKSWEKLLAGGRGRPTRIPATVELIPVAAASVPAFSGYELRGLRVRPGAGWVEFLDEWPAGVTPPAPKPVLTIECAGYPVPARFSVKTIDPWLEEHILKMNGDQFDALVTELRRRGWTDDELAQRVYPRRVAD